MMLWGTVTARGGNVVKCFESFLQGHTYRVVIGNCTSITRPLTCGVPQGSIHSPNFFNIYMELLGELVRWRGLKYHQYADDTQLYLSFPIYDHTVITKMAQSLGATSSSWWMKTYPQLFRSLSSLGWITAMWYTWVWNTHHVGNYN